jgi:hypothetical protein
MFLNRVLSQQIRAEVDVQYDTGGYCLQMVVPLPTNSTTHLIHTPTEPTSLTDSFGTAPARPRPHLPKYMQNA